MTEALQMRDYRPGDEGAAYYVCLKTGDHGRDGEPLFREDPDALGRIYVGPYLKFAPELALILDGPDGVCGYALGAMDTREFYRRYEEEWRPDLCRRFPDPPGPSERWTRVQEIHHLYHHPEYWYPEPYASYPSHLHIDLLPSAQGRGFGRRMMEELMRRLEAGGSPGVHLGMSAVNHPAYQFYRKLDFHELAREGDGTDGSIYMGRQFGKGEARTASFS